MSEADEREYRDAIEGLAALLYWKIEHLDPGDEPEFVEWSDLDDGRRELWRQGIGYVLRNGGAFLLNYGRYMGLPTTT